MDSREAAGKMQRIQAGCRCEEVGCQRQAEWYINFRDGSFYWCPKHTVKHMRERNFWQVKLTNIVGR